MKKVLIVAGETSADLYGSLLIKAMCQSSLEVRFFGLGGPRMQAAGVELLANITHLAGTGLDPLSWFGTLARVFRQLKASLFQEKPDLVVLMDFPDFNLRFAREVQRVGIPIVYYISPQVWAWRPGRLKTIRQLIDKMLVIFEFEKSLYEEYHVPVVFVGHPLLDIIGEIRNSRSISRNRLGLETNGLVIGLLPGSRQHEFRRHFPLMQKAGDLIRDKYSETKFLLAKAPDIPEKLLHKFLSLSSFPIQVCYHKVYDVLQASDIVIISSGTATIEATILDTPMVVIYKVSLITALLLGPLIKTPYYAMVNIIAGKKVVPELVQKEAQPHKIAQEIFTLLESNRLTEMKEALESVRNKLGPPGASQRAAQEILKMMR